MTKYTPRRRKIIKKTVKINHPDPNILLHLNMKDLINAFTPDNKTHSQWWKSIGSWPLNQTSHCRFWGKFNQVKTLVLTNRSF